MAAPRDLIRSNVGPQSGMIFDGNFGESPFCPMGWSKCTNHAVHILSLPPSNQADTNASNQTVTFEPKKNADYYGYCVLQIPFSAITPAVGATVTAWIDQLVLGAVNTWQVSHISNLLTRVDGQTAHKNYTLMQDYKAKHNLDPMILANYSLAERIQIAKGSFVGRYPTDHLFWFTYTTSDFIPVIFFSHELRFEVTFNQMNQLIYSDHPNTSAPPQASISTQTIRDVSYPLSFIWTTVHITGDERLSRAPMYEGNGLLQAFKEFKMQPRYVIQSGTQGTVSVRLTSLKDQISELWFWIIRASDLGNNYRNNPTNRLSYVAAGFTGNGGILVPLRDKEYIDQRARELHHSSLSFPRQNMGFIPYSWSTEDPVNCTGSIHLGVISDPTLDIVIGTQAGHSEAYDACNGTGAYSTPENLLVYVGVDAFNWIHMIGGDANKLFN